MKQEFKVPFMVLHRCDLEFMDVDGLNISQGISDQQMENIANHLGKILADGWDDLLENIRIGRPEWFEVQDEERPVQ